MASILSFLFATNLPNLDTLGPNLYSFPTGNTRESMDSR